MNTDIIISEDNKVFINRLFDLKLRFSAEQSYLNGIEVGKVQQKVDTIKNMYDKGYSKNDILDVLDVDSNTYDAIINEYELKKNLGTGVYSRW